MSELIDNGRKRQEILKDLILKLHDGEDPEAVRGQLTRLLGQVPYGDVVQVEQELINDGMPSEQILNLCDVHSAALRGQIDLSGMKEPPEGHPVHTFRMENAELEKLAGQILEQTAKLAATTDNAESLTIFRGLRELFVSLHDVDKHYRRKEHLLFPFLERKGVTGPPKVMWGKHDQTRVLLRAALDVFRSAEVPDAADAAALVPLVFDPAVNSVTEMIIKETQILFPMCMDLLADTDWQQISDQSPEIGYCLYDPKVRWVVDADLSVDAMPMPAGRIVLPTGSFALSELIAMFNTLPIDLTFVDKDDRVRYFSLGPDRIFDRNRTILGREVQLCHPPSSVHKVQQIINDFRSGKQDKADFWIVMGGRFIYISYFAMRGENREYLGTVEMTQDLTRLRALDGERRLLQYD